MKQYSYNIVLLTPLGDKSGIMQLCIEEENITGSLSVLKTENYFSGKMLANGQCELVGEIKTPVRTIIYFATGSLYQDTIYLSLTSEFDKLILRGTACKGKGGK